jgi:hypothetical protein
MKEKIEEILGKFLETSDSTLSNIDKLRNHFQENWGNVAKQM